MAFFIHPCQVFGTLSDVIIMMNDIKVAFVVLTIITATPVSALTFTIRPGSDIVGNVQTTTVMRGDTIDKISRKFDIGVYEIMEANPQIDPRYLVAGETLIIPTQFILPASKRSGIVINLAEMRLYYFHKDGSHVSTYPISIGRSGWETPLGNGSIIGMKKDPSWRPPDSIRALYEAQDAYLPDVVPPGPDNPLGKYALRLSITGYLIHGTNYPRGMGLRISSGCIRMFPEDIENLFHKVSVGTTVRIVNKPFKVGKHAGEVYTETHEPLSGEYYNRISEREMMYQAIEEGSARGARFDTELGKRALERSQGYPTRIE